MKNWIFLMFCSVVLLIYEESNWSLNKNINTNFL